MDSTDLKTVISNYALRTPKETYEDKEKRINGIIPERILRRAHDFIISDAFNLEYMTTLFSKQENEEPSGDLVQNLCTILQKYTYGSTVVVLTLLNKAFSFTKEDNSPLTETTQKPCINNFLDENQRAELLSNALYNLEQRPFKVFKLQLETCHMIAQTLHDNAEVKNKYHVLLGILHDDHHFGALNKYNKEYLEEFIISKVIKNELPQDIALFSKLTRSYFELNPTAPLSQELMEKAILEHNHLDYREQALTYLDENDPKKLISLLAKIERYQFINSTALNAAVKVCENKNVLDSIINIFKKSIESDGPYTCDLNLLNYFNQRATASKATKTLIGNIIDRKIENLKQAVSISKENNIIHSIIELENICHMLNSLGEKNIHNKLNENEAFFTNNQTRRKITKAMKNINYSNTTNVIGSYYASKPKPPSMFKRFGFGS